LSKMTLLAILPSLCTNNLKGLRATLTLKQPVVSGQVVGPLIASKQSTEKLSLLGRLNSREPAYTFLLTPSCQRAARACAPLRNLSAGQQALGNDPGLFASKPTLCPRRP